MILDIPNEKLQQAIQVLELALHPSTCDPEALNAINGFRRIAKGTPLRAICEHLYGDGVDLDFLAEEWEDRLAKSTMEISRLRGELRRTKKALDDSRRHTDEPVCQDQKDTPSLILADDEWAIIEGLIPENHRTAKGRERISAMIVVLRTNCGWRVIDKWTTYYNQYRTWQYEDWWTAMLKALDEG